MDRILLAVDSCAAVEMRAAPPADWLDSGEWVRVQATGRAVRRRQFLAGRWLLRELLSEDAGAGRPHEWRLSATAGAAPVVLARPAAVANCDAWDLGVSHSGDHIAAAVSRGRRLGIDIETIRPRDDLLGLAGLACDDAELADLARMDSSERLIHFHLLWSAKEAWLKRWGGGLDPARLRCLHSRPALPQDAWRVFVTHCDRWSLAVACAATSRIQWAHPEPARVEWQQWAVDDDLPATP